MKILPAACVLTIPLLFSQAATVARAQALGEPCLPTAEFSLFGVKLDHSEAAARRILGRPQRITRGQEEDDGGLVNVTSLHYRHLTIDVVRGKVDRLSTNSHRAATPSGIRPGMKFEDVAKALEKKPRATGDREYSYTSCDETKPAAFVLKLNRRMTLSSVAIYADRP